MGNWAPATSVTRTPNMVPANGNGQLPVPSPSNEAFTMFALPARRFGTLIALTAATLASRALSNAATVDSTSVVVAHAKLLDQTGARIGTAEFREDRTGTVRIDVTVVSTTPGLHGLHIHTTGSCAGTAFADAGGTTTRRPRITDCRMPVVPTPATCRTSTSCPTASAAFRWRRRESRLVPP